MAVNVEEKQREYARRWRAAMRVFRDGMNQLFILDQEMNNAELTFADPIFTAQAELEHFDVPMFDASRVAFRDVRTYVSAQNHHKKFDKIL